MLLSGFFFLDSSLPLVPPFLAPLYRAFPPPPSFLHLTLSSPTPPSSTASFPLNSVACPPASSTFSLSTYHILHHSSLHPIPASPSSPPPSFLPLLPSTLHHPLLHPPGPPPARLVTPGPENSRRLWKANYPARDGDPVTPYGG